MKEIRSVAVGFDGSQESEHAVRWAAHATREFGALLTVLHASGILERLETPPAFSHSVPPETVAAIMRDEGLDDTRWRWVVDEGDACTALLQSAAAPLHAELLVVGSRGHGKKSGMLMGSVSLEVVQHARVPVVVVPSLDADGPG